MASVKLLSADAIDDEWWSETAGRKRKSAEGVGSQRKRRKKFKVEDGEAEMVSSALKAYSSNAVHGHKLTRRKIG